MNPYEVLKTLIKMMEEHYPETELLKEAQNMLEDDLSTEEAVTRAQALITDIQNILHARAPKNLYFGVRDGKIGYWPYERKHHG